MTQPEAKQTPLPNLLDKVPEDIVLGIPGEEPMFQSYTNIAIGKLAQQAAYELRRLHTDNEKKSEAIQRLWKERDELRVQRDELLEALKDAHEHIFVAAPVDDKESDRVLKVIKTAVAKAEGRT